MFRYLKRSFYQLLPILICGLVLNSPSLAYSQNLPAQNSCSLQDISVQEQLVLTQFADEISKADVIKNAVDAAIKSGETSLVTEAIKMVGTHYYGEAGMQSVLRYLSYFNIGMDIKGYAEAEGDFQKYQYGKAIFVDSLSLAFPELALILRGASAQQDINTALILQEVTAIWKKAQIEILKSQQILLEDDQRKMKSDRNLFCIGQNFVKVNAILVKAEAENIASHCNIQDVTPATVESCLAAVVRWESLTRQQLKLETEWIHAPYNHKAFVSRIVQEKAFIERQKLAQASLREQLNQSRQKLLQIENAYFDFWFSLVSSPDTDGRNCSQEISAGQSYIQQQILRAKSDVRCPSSELIGELILRNQNLSHWAKQCQILSGTYLMKQKFIDQSLIIYRQCVNKEENLK